MQRPTFPALNIKYEVDMKNMTRRQMIKSGGTAAAALAIGPNIVAKRIISSEGKRDRDAKIPLIHITDLYHPPQDPDDLLDFATVMALDEFDLKGVALDITRKFLIAAPEGFDIPRDPGFVPVTQLSYLTGRAVPVAMGPIEPLKNPKDPATGLPSQQEAAIRMVLDILSGSSQPVVISSVGSARIITASYNREPDLLKEKVAYVVLNAGSTGGPKTEWNAELDAEAYVGLWRSGLPIRWYPPSTESGAFDPASDRGTYWKASHAELFKSISDPLRAWITFTFTGNWRGDIIRALSELGNGSVWQDLLAGERNMWSTASLVMAAGRVLARTPEGWRFVPQSGAGGYELWPWRLDRIEASVNDNGQVSWKQSANHGNTMLFGRRGGTGYGVAMADAFNALLRGMHV